MDAIYDAKEKFLKTGRLNRKVIRDEVALSWYKCQLNHLSHNKKPIADNKNIKNQIIDNLVPDMYDYYLVDENLCAIQHRTLNHQTGVWGSLGEHEIGTNAVALSKKYSKIFHVEKEEHYLDCFSRVNTMGIPLKREEEIIGYLMLVSDLDLKQYRYFDMVKKIPETLQLINNAEQIDELYQIDTNLVLEDVVMHKTNDYAQSLIKDIKPILISGAEGTGKTTLALDIFLTHKINPYIFDCRQIPKRHQESILRSCIENQDYMIIEHIEDASLKVQHILTGIIDRNTNPKEHLLGLIFTMHINHSEAMKDKLQVALYERLKNVQIHLSDFHQMDTKVQKEFLSGIINQNSFECSKMEQNKIYDYVRESSTKEIMHLSEKALTSSKQFTKNSLIDCKIEKCQPIQEIEINYLIQVYEHTDHNISLTCDILGISRSTFYRKLEKTQFKLKT